MMKAGSFKLGKQLLYMYSGLIFEIHTMVATAKNGLIIIPNICSNMYIWL